MRIFPEEKALMRKLSDEWRMEVKTLLADVHNTFEIKGQTRDKTSVVWERLQFPHGFMQVILQKVTRIPPMLEPHEPNSWASVMWGKVEQELRDVGTYCFIMAAIVRMLQRRYKEGRLS